MKEHGKNTKAPSTRQLQYPFRILEAYRSAVNAAAIVSITDANGIIVYANEKFVEVSKYSEQELLGKSHRIVNSGYHPQGFFKEMWKTITSGESWRGDIKNKAKDGSYYWVDTVIVPIYAANNTILQYLSIRNLITTQKDHEERLLQFQQQLLKQQQQLKDAQQVSKTGSWHLDLETNNLKWSDEAYNIFEIAHGTPMTYELFLEKVHPADRKLVADNWTTGLINHSYAIEHRIITAGSEKWVREQARFEKNSKGQVVNAIGTVQDITEKKKTEEHLKESETLYKNLFHYSPFAIGLLDKKNMRFIEVNETAMHLYGYSKKEFKKLTMQNLIVAPKSLVEVQTVDESSQWNKNIQVHQKKNGDSLLAEIFLVDVDYKGKPALLLSINDVTDKIAMQKQLLETKIEHEKEISRTFMEGQEKNRDQIGKELHDNVNQLLSVATIHLRLAKQAPDHSAEMIEKSVSIIQQAIDEIRKLSSSLIPPSLDILSLKEAIVSLVASYQFSNTAFNFDISIDETRIDKGLKINIYRIIQEQCNNIFKYAQAAMVKIKLKHKAHMLQLEIADDGKGFEPGKEVKGIGLRNIVKRAEAYSGKATIHSAVGLGCSISILFPL